jgi:glyoxylase-like metal-dependent hydrolase (beta-lactamase superfamily II)
MENKIIPGIPVELGPGLMRITAPNPGVMTGPGTNTYIVGTSELVLIDPGPDSEPHLEALVSAVAGRLKWILCTHTHRDHSPGARALKARTGALVAGLPAPQDGRQDENFAPDRVLRHGDIVAVAGCALRAVHTPGHASNHLCYLLEQQRVLFTGDHVMQGSTVVISPPDGDMTAYFASLASVLELDLARLAPGHGHPIDTPYDEVRRLIAHRLKREQKTLAAVLARPGGTLETLVALAYDDAPQRLHGIAQRSLHAHLIKLESEGSVTQDGGGWSPVGKSGRKSVITLADYYMGRDALYPDELTAELEANARTTVERVNELLERAGIVECTVSSGWRPAAVNAQVAGAAPRSKHIVCLAIDLDDEDGLLDAWCMEHLDVLEAIGLWLEHPSATEGWCHLQSVQYGSWLPGRPRYFYP